MPEPTTPVPDFDGARETAFTDFWGDVGEFHSARVANDAASSADLTVATEDVSHEAYCTGYDAGRAAIAGQLEHAAAALAGDNEGIRLWMLDCAELTQKHRQRADQAETALAALRVYAGQLHDQEEAHHAGLVRDGLLGEAAPFGGMLVAYRNVLARIAELEAGQGTGKSGTAQRAEAPLRGSESAEAQNRPPAASNRIIGWVAVEFRQDGSGPVLPSFPGIHATPEHAERDREWQERETARAGRRDRWVVAAVCETGAH